MGTYYEIGLSALSPKEKQQLYASLDKGAFTFDEAGLGWQADAFHFLPYGEPTVEELRRRYQIPDRCPVRPYVHPR